MASIGVYLRECPWGDVGPELLSRGLGGRETALLHLCGEWGNTHDVYAFVPRSDTETWEQEHGGTVRFIPQEKVLDVAPYLGLDAFISWEDVHVLAELGEADVGYRVIEMQVAHLHSEVPISSFTHSVAVLSEWAGRLLLEQHPDMTGRLMILPNGVDLLRFDHPLEKKGEKAADFVYSSSPDRGLHHLLRMWPEICHRATTIYQRLPKLHICYGIENFLEHALWSHREDSQRALYIRDLLDQPNVIYHGRIGQDELAQIQMRSIAMLYPCDTMSPTETGCISAVESLAARTPFVATDCDCLGSEYGSVASLTSLPLDYDEYISRVEIVLAGGKGVDEMVSAGRKLAEERSWSRIADSWLRELNLSSS